ncbi:unnamed protein product [Prorocentrum cordatum]|uniref:Tyrosine-protein kinase ephrin type A/B receptor-like domain-containing protein n=1 Tax=Prorocentrum cordatum TaxID=2364126 RepID=A0ABN9T7T5_9DINO|nr:unnamed protein product [Polarella glacialis]
MRRATLALFALVLSGRGCAADQNTSSTSANETCYSCCLTNQDLPSGMSLVPESQRKNITKGMQSMPLGMAHGSWSSTQIFANIMKIISSEVLGYNARISDDMLGSSGQAVYALGNCQPFSHNCWSTEKVEDPDGDILSEYHFVFEVYENYFRSQQTEWETNYPEKAPEVIGTVGYVGDEGFYVNPVSIADALTEDQLILDYYQGYNSNVFNATAMSSHFTPLDQIDASLLQTCTALLDEDYTRYHGILKRYNAQFPNDTTVSETNTIYVGQEFKFAWQCFAYGADTREVWWMSPSCRHKPETCIPVVTKNLWGSQIMQQAAYYHMPLAVASVYDVASDGAEWKSLVANNKLLTFWWFPDDLFILSDLKLLTFPPYNKEEQEAGLEVSQLQSIPLRKLMAKGLGAVASDLALVGANVWVPFSNMVAMLKRRVQDGESVANLACEWVRENSELWHGWLPGELECNPGQGLVDEAGEFLSSKADAAGCGWCEPGTFSDFWNGTSQRICMSCPAGTFQKSPGQTACESCSSGKFTSSEGNTACTDCGVGTYAEGSDNTACTSCATHESTMIRGATTSWECVCDDGYFRAKGHSEMDGVHAECNACPQGMDCEKGDDDPPPKLLAGFWVSEQDGIDREYSVYRCRDELECPGGDAGTCADGRDPSEIGCASCKENHHVGSNGECQMCQGSAVLPLIGAAIATLCGLVGMAFFARVDVTKVRMNTVSVAICMSQTIMILQTLSLFFTMKVNWIDPIKSMFTGFSVAAFDFSVLNLSCGVSDSDVVSKYALRLLSFPLCLAMLCLVFAIFHFVLRAPISKDHIINSIGVLTLVFFLMLNMTGLSPFHCISSPNGTSSLSSNPSVICFEDSEWTAMAVMGIIAVLVYGVGFFSVASYVTLNYPALVIHEGSIVMSRYRFMFQRFTAKCYYFTPVYLIRTLLIALIPVIFADHGHRQMIFLVLVMVVFGFIHARYLPWRGAIPNALDIHVMGCMILLLTCSSLLLTVDAGDMTADLEVFFTIIMVFVFGAIGIFLASLAYRRFVPKDRWTAFLCHISDTAITARWVKMEMEKRMVDKNGIFLASDNLDWNLEDIFDLMRCQLADNIVILLSGGTLSNPHCAGQITTAYTNGVQMVPVALDSYTELCDEDLDEAVIAKRWAAEAFRRCTAEGISLTMVKDAYAALSSKAKISCRVVANRLAKSHSTTLYALAEVSSTCGAGKAADGPEEKGGDYAVGVIADVCDAEAIATVEVLKIMVGAINGWELKGLMQESEVRQAQAPSQLLLVVLTRGCLGSEIFVQTANAAVRAWPSVPILAARTDDFSFPTEETMQKVLAPQISKGAEILEEHVSSIYAKLLASSSVTIVANARMSSLEKQVGYLTSCAAELASSPSSGGEGAPPEPSAAAGNEGEPGEKSKDHSGGERGKDDGPATEGDIDESASV